MPIDIGCYSYISHRKIEESLLKNLYPHMGALYPKSRSQISTYKN